MVLSILFTILPSLFAALQEKVFESDFVVTVTEQTTQPLSIPGTITMHGKCFYLTMMGIDAAYDGTDLYMYQADASELTISAPTKDELQTANPLIFAQDVAEHANVVERPSKDGAYTYITITPEQAVEDISRVVVKVHTDDMIPVSIEVKEGKKTTLLTLLNPRYEQGEIPAFQLSESNYPNVYVNDLR